MDLTTMIIFGVGAVVLLFVLATYNSLASAKVRIKEALSGIDVQLKRRIDLIPNLVETVKGYVKHEKGVLENVTKARSMVSKAETVEEKAASNNMLTDALKTLFAVAENYPDLKANKNFEELQRELAETEDQIAASRQFYNGNVRDYNTTLATFPSGIIGSLFGFKPEEFFAATDEERKAIKVTF